MVYAYLDFTVLFRSKQQSPSDVHRALKNALYKLKEKIIINMVKKKAQEKVFDSSIDRWTLSTSFMGAITSRA